MRHLSHCFISFNEASTRLHDDLDDYDGHDGHDGHDIHDVHDVHDDWDVEDN